MPNPLAADVLVVVACTALAVALGGVTFLLTRRAAADARAVDRRLRPQEATTGRCGACDGRGWRKETVTLRGGVERRTKTRWRCDGSGQPPSVEPVSGLPPP